MYKDIKHFAWVEWDYETQRDVYRDMMISRYTKQAQKLRRLTIHDSATRCYNTVDLEHVNTLREAQKSFNGWKNGMRVGERELWSLYRAFSESLYNTKLSIDAGRYTPKSTFPTASLPGSEAARSDPSTSFPPLPGNEAVRSDPSTSFPPLPGSEAARSDPSPSFPPLPASGERGISRTSQMTRKISSNIGELHRLFFRIAVDSHL